jgi:hypothetical protein
MKELERGDKRTPHPIPHTGHDLSGLFSRDPVPFLSLSFAPAYVEMGQADRRGKRGSCCRTGSYGIRDSGGKIQTEMKRWTGKLV